MCDPTTDILCVKSYSINKMLEAIFFQKNIQDKHLETTQRDNWALYF